MSFHSGARSLYHVTLYRSLYSDLDVGRCLSAYKPGNTSSVNHPMAPRMAVEAPAAPVTATIFTMPSASTSDFSRCSTWKEARGATLSERFLYTCCTDPAEWYLRGPAGVPNASYCILTHLNASQCILMHPNAT